MASIYHLGWPGMELLPCIIVDQRSREMYHIKKPLPTRKASLVTPENKYVEFAKVLSFFDVEMQQEAMNTFMSISSDYSVRKFFMDNNQKAYISVDTLLVYVMVYPKCPAFEKARRQTMCYLQEWLDYPCLVCGFIKRSGCLCSEDNPCDGERMEYIGYCTESVDRQIQTDLTAGMLTSAYPAAAAPPAFQQPPLPPLVTPFIAQGTSHAIASVIPTQITSGPLSTPRIASVTPVMSNVTVSRTTIPSTTTPQIQSEDRPIIRIPPPVQAVAPLVQVKPKMRDIGIQTRANFDFTPRNRGRKKKEMEMLDPSKPALGDPSDKSLSSTPSTASPNISTSQTSENKANDSENVNKDNAKPSTSDRSTPSLPFPQTVASQAAKAASSSDPIKVSLWKLLDSESEDEEEEKKKKDQTEKNGEKEKKEEDENAVKKKDEDEIKKEEEENKKKEIEALRLRAEREGPEIEKAMREGYMIDPISGMLVDKDGRPYPKSATQEDERKSETQHLDGNEGKDKKNTDATRDSTNSHEDETDPKYQEAYLSNAKENVTSTLLVEQKEDVKDSSQDIDEVGEISTEQEIGDQTSGEQIEAKIGADVSRLAKIAISQEASKEKADEDVVDDRKNNSENQQLLDQKPENENDIETSMEIDQTENAETKDSDIDPTVETSASQPEDKPNDESDLKKPEEHTKEKTASNGPVFVLTNEPTKPSTEDTKQEEKLTISVEISDNPLTIILPDEKKEKVLTKEEKDKKEKEAKEKLEKDEAEKLRRQFKKWYHKFEYVPTQEKLYRCTFRRCGQCFDTKKAAELHNRVHGLFGQEHSSSLLCYKCEYMSPLSRWFDMVRHLKDKHNEVITKDPLGCHFCGKILENEEKLYRHIDFHYMGRYKCVFCGFLGFTWKQLEMHLESGCELKGKREKHLGCPYCPLVFHLRNMRNAHMLAHTDSGLVCCFCKDKNIWDSWTELRKHYQQKHGEKIRSALNPHRSIKTPINIQRSPECHVCAHQSKTMEDFIYHMRKKHDFIPYVLSQCEVCEKTFKSEKMFDWHMKHTHGHEVRCPKCDFVARNDLQLKTHDESQHQSKEFECMECGKEFRLYHQLRMHMAHHALHTIYNCKECGAEFKRQKDLRAHVKKDHPVNEETNKNKCPDCDFESFNKRTLEIHIKRNHPKLAEEIEESETHAVPATPDHGYFNTKSSPPEESGAGSRPALRDRRTSTRRASERRTSDSLVIDEENVEPSPVPPKSPVVSSSQSSAPKKKFGKKKKGAYSYYNKKKAQSKKLPYSAELDENGDPIESEMSEKRRLKLEMREKIDALKVRIKESSVRTRTYEENRDLKNLKRKKKDDVEDASVNTTTAEDGEIEPKRQRVSKYGRNLAPKSYDDDTYEAPRTRERRNPPRASAFRKATMEGAIAPPDSWDDDVNIKYPFNDHCYFSLDFAQDSADYQRMISREKRHMRSPEYRHQSEEGGKWNTYGDDFAPSTSQGGLQHSFRIGPGGVRRPYQKMTPHQMKRKQKFGSGFTQLQPDTRNLPHEYSAGQDQQQQGRDDMTFDDLDSDLIREVSQDPLLQNIIDSMDQQNVQSLSSGQDSPNKAYLQSQQGMASQGRQSMPPSSLNLNASVSQVLTPMSPPSTPTRPGTSAGSVPPPNPNAGLTPTKQSVIDLLLSKIELNEDQLNRLIEEQNKDEGAVSDNTVAHAQSSLLDNTKTGDQEGEVLSLEQLAGSNIASITRINTGEPNTEPDFTTTNQNQQNQDGQQQPITETSETSGDVPIANEEVRVHAGSDTDSNPDLEGEMMQAGVVPPPEEVPGTASFEDDVDIDVTDTPVNPVVQRSSTDFPGGSQTMIGQPQTAPISKEQSSSEGASFRAITMPDGRGGTVRKIVRLVSKEGTTSTASQLIQSHLLPETSSSLTGSRSENQYSHQVDFVRPSQNMNVSGAQISISSTPLGATSDVSTNFTTVDDSVTGQRIITAGPQVVQHPGTSTVAPPTTRIIHRVLTEGSKQTPQPQQQGIVRRVVQVGNTNPQVMAQRRIVTMGRRPLTSIRPRSSGIQVLRSSPVLRGRPRGRPPIMTSQQPRIHTLAPTPPSGVSSGAQVIQIARQPRSGEGSVKVISSSSSPVDAPVVSSIDAPSEIFAQVPESEAQSEAPAQISIQATSQEQNLE